MKLKRDHRIMSIGLEIGTIKEAVEGMKILFPAISSWLEIESDAMAGFSETGRVEGLLDEIKSRLLASVMGERPGGATMDRGRFMEEVRNILRDARYRRPEGVDQKSFKSLKSYRRLGLIWDLTTAHAHGYAHWKSDMTPEGLENEPCYELICVRQIQPIRDWPKMWWQQGGSFLGSPNTDYPNSTGRMIAKKTAPIWRWINRFGTPWAPFDWDQSMGLQGIGIDEAETLGAIAASQEPQKADSNFSLSGDLNEADSFTSFVAWMDENLTR